MNTVWIHLDVESEKAKLIETGQNGSCQGLGGEGHKEMWVKG